MSLIIGERENEIDVFKTLTVAFRYSLRLMLSDSQQSVEIKLPVQLTALRPAPTRR
jgi:hypothetical protein